MAIRFLMVFFVGVMATGCKGGGTRPGAGAGGSGGGGSGGEGMVSSVSAASGSVSAASGSVSAASGSVSAASGTVGDASAQAEAFCTAVAPAFCKAFFACCRDPLELAANGGTLEGCYEQMASRCDASMMSAVKPNIMAGSTELNPARLDACVAKLDGMARGAAACTGPAWFTYFYECLAAFEGKLPKGAACDADKGYFHTLCADGVCVTGTCQLRLPTGATCTADERSPSCGPGEWCMLIDGAAQCSPGAGLGESCGKGDTGNQGCITHTCGDDGKCAPISDAALCKDL